MFTLFIALMTAGTLLAVAKIKNAPVIGGASPRLFASTKCGVVCECDRANCNPVCTEERSACCEE